LNFNGGYVVVNSAGDGLDSNDKINFNGGTIIVHAPFDRAGEPLDYDGAFKITGGDLIAVGTAAKNNFSSTASTQNLVSINLPAIQEVENLVRIRDENGKEIITFRPKKKYQSIVFSSKTLVKGTYDLILGGTSAITNTDGLLNGGMTNGGSKNQSFAVTGLVTLVGEQQTHGPK
jgi:hypothetical protein